MSIGGKQSICEYAIDILDCLPTYDFRQQFFSEKCSDKTFPTNFSIRHIIIILFPGSNRVLYFISRK